MHESPKALLLDRIASNILLVTLALSPLFFIPFLGLGVEVGKTYFIGLGVLVSFVLWVVARMIQGVIVVPKTPLMFVVASLPVTFLISAFFSPAWSVSLAGLSLASSTVFGILMLVLVFYGSVLYLSTEQKIKSLVGGLYITAGIVTVFQILYWIVGARILNLGTFFTSVSNLVGKWFDLGIWYGLILIISTLVMTYVPVVRRTKILIIVAAVISGVMLVVINIPVIWAVIGFTALLLFTYTLLRDREGDTNRFPVMALIVLVVSMLCFLAYPLIGSITSGTFGLTQTDIRPSLVSTGHVVVETLKHHPILGVGPSRFAGAWNSYQPDSIIRSNYWNLSFNSGSGFLPTLPVTTGILGTISMGAFLILFLLFAIGNVFRRNDPKTHFYILGSGLTAIYLWIMAFVYSPGIVALLGAFAVSGICVGVVYASGKIQSREIHFLKDPRLSFFAIVGLIILLLGSCYALFAGVEKFISLTLYSRAQARTAVNDVSTAGTLLAKAAALYPSDIYARAMTSTALTQLNLLLQNQSLSQDIIKSEFKNILSLGEQSAQRALAYDRTNPDNWTNMGLLYQSVIPLQITGAYDNAKTAFEEAGKLQPRNPDIDLYRAKLEVVNKNRDGAKSIITEALKKKPNYVSGIFLLAELEAASGNSDAAIASIEDAVTRDPRNASLYLALGVFKYDDKDYAGAVSALERSITLDPTVPNTRYLLGLAYAKTGKTAEARALFVSLQNALPNNETVKKIIANLDAGKDPLDGLSQAAAQIPDTNQDEAETQPTSKQTTPKPKTKQQ